MRKFLILLTLVFILAGCNSKETSFEHATYNYSEFGITFKYPKEWYIRDDVNEGNFIFALSKEGKGFTHPSSVLITGSKPKDMEFIERQLVIDPDEDTEIVDDQQMNINNQKARQVRMEFTDNGVTMKFL